MTAKHRKGKGNHNHKHGEDNFFKNDATETEVRGGSGNYAPHLVLLAVVLIGGAAGAWFCLQQQQTLAQLTDSFTGMQVKMVKLQSSHEEVRQSSSKHISESLETRLSALEESFATAQKQVAVALATAEQLRTSDLPAQVLSLHTEMETRLAEMQQATVSLEQLGQLQAALREKSEEFEEVKIQVEGLTSHGAELSQKVETLAGSLGEAEAKLEPAGQVPGLSTAVEGQAAELSLLKERLDSYQARLEERMLEVAALRESLEREESQRLQQASVEEQISSLRQSLQDQTSAAKSATAGLEAQLEDVQKQIAELVGKTHPPAEPADEPEEETTPPAAKEEEQQEVEEVVEAAPEELEAPPEPSPEVEAAAPTPVEEVKEDEEEDQTGPDGAEAAEEEEEEEGVEEVGQTAGDQELEDVQEEPTAEEEPEVEEQVDAATEEESDGKEETPDGDQEEGGEVKEEEEEQDVSDGAGEEHAAPAEQEESEGDDSGEDDE